MPYYMLVGIKKYTQGDIDIIACDSNRLHLTNLKRYETDYIDMEIIELVDSRSTTIQHKLNELNGLPDPL